MFKHYAYISPIAVMYSILSLPFFASAQGNIDIGDVLVDVADFINASIVFFVLLATAVFMWGIVRYISAHGDQDQIAEARKFIVWGIIFLAVMVAIWGFVALLLNFVFDDPNAINNNDVIPPGPRLDKGALP
ncbi:MAG: hypothetical protein COU90_01520 [Candidatus Ryanbacteria bacterium CG10_big_fil_rev_8_21_14_0_10_43_42]|uniref:Uncharacterized protein n=1 Tax=Candidatus Ryanbacteria bacterium CG10_big_fil_rev_8_21_14_0_10_43_42 TaxID=1974864 RepID=A0A2M8KX97_9BACT|nr:MAG: hypothetical protein COU90_01520 [Candidatus Ryanbacteria bacterium CG10_big_fil_rev_8_21_14_0_10_43_42]